MLRFRRPFVVCYQAGSAGEANQLEQVAERAVADALRDRQIADPADGSVMSGHLEGLDEDSRRALAGSPENS
jgi:hypothetical protein